MAEPRSLYLDNFDALRSFDRQAAMRLEIELSRAGVSARPIDAEGAWVPVGYPPQDSVVLLGAGDGGRLERLLATTPAQVIVAECDAVAWRHLLERVALANALESGRLRLLVPCCASPVSREVSLRECLPLLLDRLHRPGGTLHFMETATTAWHAGFYHELRDGVLAGARTVGEFRQAASAGFAYDVTVISPCCEIFDDLARCFQRLGLATQLLRVPDSRGVWSDRERRETLLSLARNPSRLIVTRNRVLFEAELPNDYAQIESLIPGQVVSWWWDVPNLATHAECRYPRGQAIAMGFARDILRQLPAGSEWLPPGARSGFVDAGMQSLNGHDLPATFVGQSRIGLVHSNVATLARVLADLGGDGGALAADLGRFEGYERLYRYLLRQRDAVVATIRALHAAFPVHAYFMRYLFDMALTGAFRVAAIERLVREKLPVVIYGDDDWLKVPGVAARHFEGLIHPAELPGLYRRSALNLNLNFMQVSSTVNPKVLDIAAAGAAVLTDYRPEVDILYPDPASRPFVFHDLDELPERVQSLLRRDLARQCEAVREHTVRHHTLQQRAQRLAARFGLI